jgi:hypothetical protein
MGTQAKKRKLADVATPRTPESSNGRVVKRGTREQAIEIIFRTAIEDEEGFRHGVLGKPRMGKTFHLKDVVNRSVEQGLAEIAYIHDCKKQEVQYDGKVFASVEEFKARGLEPGDPPFVIFHARPTELTVDSVAKLALDTARGGDDEGTGDGEGMPVVVLPDELYHGLKSRQTWQGPNFGIVLREGSSQRVSSAWTTQIPQALPTESLDLTETFAVFKLSGRSLRYVMDNMSFPDEAADVIRRLERGEFVLDTGDDWDWTVYGPT